MIPIRDQLNMWLSLCMILNFVGALFGTAGVLCAFAFVIVTQGAVFWIIIHKDDCTAYSAVKAINQILAVVIFFVVAAALLAKELG